MGTPWRRWRHLWCGDQYDDIVADGSWRAYRLHPSMYVCWNRYRDPSHFAHADCYANPRYPSVYINACVSTPLWVLAAMHMCIRMRSNVHASLHTPAQVSTCGLTLRMPVSPFVIIRGFQLHVNTTNARSNVRHSSLIGNAPYARTIGGSIATQRSKMVNACKPWDGCCCCQGVAGRYFNCT